MVSNKKIFRLAKHMLDYQIKDVRTPTDMSQNLLSFSHYNEYYSHLGPDNFIKLIIATWCLYVGYPHNKIEEIFDKLFFATVFCSNGENWNTTCKNCAGDGAVDCEKCDGQRRFECETCDGTGEVECDECDGVGEIEIDQDEDVSDWVECQGCKGEGTMRCYDCNGRGEVECSRCGGSGQENCKMCGGNGEVETDEVEYTEYFIACWDQNLKNLFELKDGQLEPVMTEDDFLNSTKLLILGRDLYQHDELLPQVEFDKIYCLDIYENRPNTNINFYAGYKTLFTVPYSPTYHLVKPYTEQ